MFVVRLRRLGIILGNILLAVPGCILCGLASAAFGANVLAMENAVGVGRFALLPDDGTIWMPIDQLFMGAAVAAVCLLSSRLLHQCQREHWWIYGLIGFLTGFAVITIAGGTDHRVETLFAAGFGGIACWFICRRRFMPAPRNRRVTWGGVASLVLLASSALWLFSRVDADERTQATKDELAPILAVATTRSLWLVIDENTLIDHDRITGTSRRLDQKDLRALAADSGTAWSLSDHLDSPLTPASHDYPSGTIDLRTYDSHGRQKSWNRHHDAGDSPMAMTLVDGRPLILTEQSVLRLAADGQWQVTRLRKPPGMRFGGTRLAMAKGDTGHLYGGNNQGEFGGGAFLIDLTSGQVDPIERRDSADLCAGPLNTECSPVTGIAPDPARADCVLASTGLEHMGGIDGAILRLCGRQVEVVSQTPLAPTVSLLSRAGEGASTPRLTDAIYGLTQDAKGTVWAMGGRRLYRIDRKELSLVAPPHFSQQGGLRTAMLPGMMLIARVRTGDAPPTGRDVLLVPVPE